ncbi:MAG TPA: LysR family transcriptional regulator [Jatrophihabitans sp.]|nr:LysR family transcriptional regulator [Jatrophihabitans sp.]
MGYFVATVDAGSATRAAPILHLTQPTLSRQLHQLERSLGLDLFNRQGRHLALTPAGETFLPLARELLQRAEQVERIVSGMRAGVTQRLRFAVPTTTLSDVVAPFIASLGPGDPIVTVSELDPRGAEAALQSGADVAIVASAPTPAVAARTLVSLPVWAYVPPADPWSDREEITLRELVERRLVLLDATFRPRQVLDAAVAAANLSFEATTECSNAQVAQALAASGNGVAVVTDDPRFDLAALRIRIGRGRYLRIRLYAAWEPTHHAAATISGFADRLAAFARERYPER